MKYLLLLPACLYTIAATAQTKDKTLKGNVQIVQQVMQMRGGNGDTMRMKTIYRYDDNGNMTDETRYMDASPVGNNRVVYTFNTAGVLINKTRYLPATNSDNGIIADIYEYDDMGRMTKEKTSNSRRSDSIRFWYIGGDAGKVVKYGISSISPKDTIITTTDARGNVTEMKHTGSKMQFNYVYNGDNNVIEERHSDMATGALKRRVVTEYNVEQLPVAIKEYDGSGKLVDQSETAYTNMDDHGNYLRNTCLRNGKFAYAITNEIVYRP
ncbi:MAG: hypothetical protein EOP51_01160 [Sphingobacteriales bacterium]|nr:MAG: hypothetical protein EOP51_01160 [Sphingobacteriales bacterium]